MKFAQKFVAGTLLPILLYSLSLSAVRAQEAAGLVRITAAHLKKIEREDDFSGVVLIAQNGKPIFNKAYGLANRADGIPNNANTKFNLASMNKMFTGVAVMQLVESGKISLTEKIEKYLPDYPNKVVAQSVSIEQLLTHTSGMGNFWSEFGGVAKEEFKTPEDYLPLFVDQKLLFTPGTKFSYSNSGFMVLGLVIEKVTGQSYFDYVREKIYKPAGMKDTDAYELDVALPNIATGYTMSLEKPGEWKNNIYTNVVKGTPAGGGYSTASDLLKFAAALQNFKLLKKETTKLATTGKIKYERGMYGYGFSESSENGHRAFGHSGGHFGIANEMLIYPDLGYVVIILTNGEVENFWEASNFIRKQLCGLTPSINNYFQTKKILEITIRDGYQAGLQAARNSDGLKLRESLIERFGYKLLFERKDRQAIDVFKLGIANFPDSSYGYYNLAEAFRVTGNLNSAMEYYQRHLVLTPGDQNAEQKLKKLIAVSSKN